jgi:hypothetical protein
MFTSKSSSSPTDLEDTTEDILLTAPDNSRTSLFDTECVFNLALLIS